MEENYEITQVRGFQVRSKNYNSQVFNSREEAQEHLKSLIPTQTPIVNNVKTRIIKSKPKRKTRR